MAVGDLVVRLVADTAEFDSSIDKSGSKFKSASATITQSAASIADKFRVLDGEAAVWGKSVDLITQKQEALKQEITTLLRSGVDPLDKSIVDLNQQYFALGKEAEELAKKQKQVTISMEDLAKVGKTLTYSVTLPLVAAAGLAIKGFADEEAAAKRLGFAVDSAGTLTAGATKRLIAYAEAMMKATGVSHELIENLMSQAIGMGRTEAEAEKLATVSADIAARGIMPLDAAFETLMVTYEGIGIRSKQLRAYTGDLTEAQLKNGDAIRIIGDAVAGTAVAMRDTTTGSMQAFKNSFDELGESFGAVIAPAFTKIINIISGLMDAFAKLDDSTKQFIVAGLGIAAMAGPVCLAISKIGTAFSTSTGPIGLVVAAVGLLIAEFLALRDEAKKWNDTTKLITDATDGLLKSSEDYKLALEEQDKRLNAGGDALAGYLESLSKQGFGYQRVNGHLQIYNYKTNEINKNLTEQADKMQQTMDYENARWKQMNSHLNEQLAKDKVLADQEAARIKIDSDAAIAKALADAEAATALQAKMDGLKAMHKAIENVGLTEQEIINKEIAQYKEWGATDVEVMAYMKATHADFYRVEETASNEITQKQIDNLLLIAQSDKYTSADLRRWKKEKEKEDEEERKKRIAAANAEANAQLSIAAGVLSGLKKLAESNNKDIGGNILEFTKDIANATGTAEGKIVAEAIGLLQGIKDFAMKVGEIVFGVQKSGQEEMLQSGAVYQQLYNQLISNVNDLLNQQLRAIDEAEKARLESLGLVEEENRKVHDAEIKRIEKERKAIDDNYNAAMEALDNELYEKLRAAGLLDETEEDRLHQDLVNVNAELAATTDAEEIKRLNAEKEEIEKQIKRQEIIDEYEAKRAKIEADAEKHRKKLEDERIAADLLAAQQEEDRRKAQEEYETQRAAAEAEAQKQLRQYQHDKAIIDQKMAIVNVMIEWQKAIAELGWFNKDKKTAVNDLYSELIRTIMAIPIPAVAEGAIFKARSGGSLAVVGEGGQDEAVIPLDRLDQMLSHGGMGGTDNIPISLTINMDSKVLYSGIFDATKRKSILINAGAVV
jgi:hypothetical protein